MGNYRDPAPLARSVILWIWIWLGLQLATGLASLYQISVLAYLPTDLPLTLTQSGPGMEIPDMVLAVAALPAFIAFLVSGFLILKWIYRTNANAQTLAQGMNVGPGWNVGWFFIPLANLWKPFQGVRETWQVSQGEPVWQDVPVPSLMRWWWGFWLVSNFLANISLRLSLRGSTAGEALTVAWIDVALALIDIPLALFLITLVRRLTRAQIDTATRDAFT